MDVLSHYNTVRKELTNCMELVVFTSGYGWLWPAWLASSSSPASPPSSAASAPVAGRQRLDLESVPAEFRTFTHSGGK